MGYDMALAQHELTRTGTLDASAPARRRCRTLTLDASGMTETVRDGDGPERLVVHAPGPGLLTRNMLNGTATLAELEARDEQQQLQSTFPEEQQLQSTFPNAGPLISVEAAGKLAKLGERLNQQANNLGEVMAWYRSQPPDRRAQLRFTTIRQARALAQPAMAVTLRAPRESRGKPTRTRGSRRTTSTRAGPSDDDGLADEPEPGERTGPPLLFLIDPRFGRVSHALARFLRGRS